MKKRILIVDGSGENRNFMKALFSDGSILVQAVPAAGDAVARMEKAEFDVVITNSSLPDMKGVDFVEVEKQKNPAVDFLVYGDGQSIEEAMNVVSRGATNYFPLNVDPEVIRRLLDKVFERRGLSEEVQYLKGRLHERYGIDSVISRSPAMEDVFKKIRAVSKTDSTVLIQGETGVGKELVANVIHTQSNRSRGRFVAINCGALPDTLLESELFGHEKGAFTGAERTRPGRFEIASGGTVFLDEISTTSPAMQIKLLRVLQERVLERVGGNESIPVDVRIIAATNHDLKELIARGSFREDLYYRVNVFPIYIPPLRERPEDVALLTAFFLKKFRASIRKNITGISDDLLRTLKEYEFPGNVRELENLVERAVIMEESSVLTPESFPIEVTGRDAVITEFDENLTLAGAREKILDNFEREYLEKLLEKYRGRISRVAEHAGISPRSVHAKMKKHKLFKEDYK